MDHVKAMWDNGANFGSFTCIVCLILTPNGSYVAWECYDTFINAMTFQCARY